MFIIEENARAYIRKQADSIVIELRFEPAMGG
jgi:hypothetical protein